MKLENNEMFRHIGQFNCFALNVTHICIFNFKSLVISYCQFHNSQDGMILTKHSYEPSQGNWFLNAENLACYFC